MSRVTVRVEGTILGLYSFVTKKGEEMAITELYVAGDDGGSLLRVMGGHLGEQGSVWRGYLTVSVYRGSLSYFVS